MSMKIGEDKHQSGSSIPVLEEGTYPAIVVQIIDLGIQPQEDYKTKEAKKPTHKVLFTFELPTETIEIDGKEKPRWLSKDYTFSFHEKSALTKVINVLKKEVKNPKYVEDFLGAVCMINVGHTSTGKAKVSGVVPKIKGLEVPAASVEPVSLDLDNPVYSVYDDLHEWIQKRIVESINFQKTKLATLLEQEDVDDNESYEDVIEFDDE